MLDFFLHEFVHTWLEISRNVLLWHLIALTHSLRSTWHATLSHLARNLLHAHVWRHGPTRLSLILWRRHLALTLRHLWPGLLLDLGIRAHLPRLWRHALAHGSHLLWSLRRHRLGWWLLWWYWLPVSDLHLVHYCLIRLILHGHMGVLHHNTLLHLGLTSWRHCLLNLIGHIFHFKNLIINL